MSRPTNRLFDLSIDEVSAVDRPANQLSPITIAKAAEGEMPEETEELVLEHGADYVDEDGNVFMYVELDDDGDPLPVEGVDFTVADDGELEAADVPERELEDAGVGKAAFGGLKRATGKLTGVKQWAQKNPGKTAAAVAGGAGVAGGGAYMEAKKSEGSAGTAVLEALSKAVTDADRDEIVAKMADDLEAANARAEAVAKALDDEREIRVTEAFIAKAAEYDLPVDANVFGPILKACAEVLSDEQLEVLDEVLTSKAGLYDELGYGGGASNNEALDSVTGLAHEIVGKAAGQLTHEQAVTAVFDTNPAAYDQYLAEQNGR
jgi:hypothetical protein